MTQLSQRLRDASDKQAWSALADVDQDVALLLAGAGKSDAMSASEQEALRDLELAHRQARILCEIVSDLLKQRLLELQTNREGWMAYALNNNQDNFEA